MDDLSFRPLCLITEAIERDDKIGQSLNGLRYRKAV